MPLFGSVVLSISDHSFIFVCQILYSVSLSDIVVLACQILRFHIIMLSLVIRFHDHSAFLVRLGYVKVQRIIVYTKPILLTLGNNSNMP